ncbi:hypothetical protein BZA70DRAFT_202570 [Myxozyma melibiosi]|uniref:Myb-like domain-containing protein n=1 Tax=Myxozyma melibiosi TaxID=54550 RepID=A0ABR1F2T1_9ASCO
MDRGSVDGDDDADGIQNDNYRGARSVADNFASAYRFVEGVGSEDEENEEEGGVDTQVVEEAMGMSEDEDDEEEEERLSAEEVDSIQPRKARFESPATEDDSSAENLSQDDSSTSDSDSFEGGSDADLPTTDGYNANYLQYLNYEIEEFMDPACHSTASFLSTDSPTSSSPSSSRITRPSLINARTRWTAAEKERFFVYLGRRTRHDPAGIARGVGSKSAIECAEYITFLESGLGILRAHERRRRAYGMRLRWNRLVRKMPAARQMSRKWVRMENEESRKLESHCERLERDRDRKAWVRLQRVRGADVLGLGPEERTLLEPLMRAREVPVEIMKIAGRVDEYCVGLLDRHKTENLGDKEFDAVADLFSPTFRLLSVEKFYELSKRLYYNQDDLPSSVEQKTDKLSIQHSTIEVLESLARQLTRRIIAAAIPITECRIRVSDKSFFRPTREIRRADIDAACAVVVGGGGGGGEGLSSSRDEFWVQFKRRNATVPVIPTTAVLKGSVTIDDVHEWFEKPLMKELKQRYQR